MAKIDQISMFTVRVQVIISNRNWCFFATNKTEKGGTEFLDLVQMSAIRIVRHTKIRGMANPYDIRWQSYFSKRSWGTYMGDLMNLRYKQFKIVFAEQLTTGTAVWRFPLVELRFPKIFNLRSNPFEIDHDTTSRMACGPGKSIACL